MKFRDIETKYLEPFEETTPEGNIISGLICTKHNRYLGSLLIKKVNGQSVEQFVQGFPKIHEWDYYHQINSSCTAFEKLDGTCIGVYPLKNLHGDIIELVPKTRNRAILNKNIQLIFDLLDKSKINAYFNLDNSDTKVLFFELYGMKNLHGIKHINTYIDIALIGVYYDKHFLNGKELITFASENDFKLPPVLFTIKEEYNCYKLFLNKDFNKFSEYYIGKDIIKHDTLYDCLIDIKNIIKEINDKYITVNKRLALEGIVLNGLTKSYNQIYIKCKPDGLKEFIKNDSKVKKGLIKKEIYKFFDEYGEESKELYSNNREFIFDYINNNLKEEDSIGENIPVNQIDDLILEEFKKREISSDIKNLAKELIKNNPSKSISELMIKFSQEYPWRKKESRLLYNAIKKEMKK